MHRAWIPRLIGCLLLLALACSQPSNGPQTGRGQPAGPTAASTAVATAGSGGSVPLTSGIPRPAVGSGSGASAGAQSFSVSMTDEYKYEPASLTIPRGATVVWTNTGQQPHSVTDDPSKALKPADAALPPGAAPFDSGILNATQTYTYTFDTPGQYTYFCIPHEVMGMVGTIIVTG